MDSQHKAASFRYLPVVCKDYSSLNTKIALMTFQNQTASKYLEILVLILEYLQLISQAIIVHCDGYESLDHEENFVTQALIVFFKSLNPASWLSFDDHIIITAIILAIDIVYIIIKYSILVYIITTTIKGSRRQEKIIKIWANLVKLQDRVLYFISTSIWISLVLASSEDNIDPLGIGKTGIVFISMIIIVTEVLFTLFLQLCYCYTLPTKSFLSSKDNKTEIITLVQKALVQFLRVFVNERNLASWIISCLNLLFSLLRDVNFFTTLPCYKMEALQYQSNLLASVTALNMSILIELIMRTSGYQTDMRFLILTWAILSLLMAKASRVYLNRIITDLMTSSKNVSAELLVHKIYLVKYFRKRKMVPSIFNDKYRYSYLLNITLETNLKGIFKIATNDLEINSKKAVSRIFLNYLEHLSITRFPKSSMIKLQIAYLYAKKLHLYSRAMRVVSEIQLMHAYKYSLTASLLVYDMQNSMKIKYTNRDTGIDFSTYLKSKLQVVQLKEKIINQARLQIEAYQEILDDRPDLEKIFELSQNIDNYRKDIDKTAKHLFSLIPDYYVEPLIVMAEYNLVLNFSIAQNKFYYDKYSQKCKKYDKYFKDERLTQENLFHEDNVFFIVSIEKASDAGKVISVTKSVERLYGGEANLYVGTDIVNTAVPCFRALYSGLFKSVVETGDSLLIGTCNRGYGYHQEGYVIEVDFYVNVHPYLTKGCYLGLMIRALPPPLKDILLVLDNGDIDGATKGIAEKLGLCGLKRLSDGTTKVHAKAISSQLGRINEAFNIIARNRAEIINKKKSNADKSFELNSPTTPFRINKRKSSGIPSYLSKTEDSLIQASLTYEEALELYNKYSSNGAEIVFHPINQLEDRISKRSNTFEYQCKVVSTSAGPIPLKIIYIESIKADQDDFEESPIKEEKGSENLTLEKNHEKPRPKTVNNQLCEEDDDNNDSGNFDFEDEKEAGITNYRSCDTGQPQSPLSPSSAREGLLLGSHDTRRTTEGFLLSPLTQDGRIVIPQAVKSRQQKIYDTYQKFHINELYKSSDIKQDAKERNTTNGKITQTNLSNHSHVSNSGQQGRISSAFANSLSIKYYPTYLKVIYILFYIMIFLSLVGQLSFKMALEESIKNINTIKDIVSGFELKNYYLMNVQLFTLTSWGIGTGITNPDNLKILSNSVTIHLSLLKNYLTSLADINAALQLNIDYINDGSHELVFKKDVRVFDSDFNDPQRIFNTLNNFQATDRVIQVGLKGVNKMAKNFTNAESEVKFLFSNTANDLLIKNEEVSATIMASMVEEGNKITNLVSFYLITIISMTGVQIIIFVILIWKQYDRNKNIMLAVIRLNKRDLNNLLDKVLVFRNIIENEEPLKKKRNIRTRININESEKNNLWRTEAKKESLIKPKLSRKKRRYTIYSFKLLIIMIFMIFGVVWICLSANSSMNLFHMKQSQLYFSLRLKSQVLLTGTLSQDLIVGNGTTFNHNVPSPIQMGKTIEDLVSMQNKMPNIFQNKDLTYDSGVDTVLFINGCFVFKDFWLKMCNYLDASSKKTNLIHLLSELQSLLIQRREKFETSDKSAATLKQLQSEDFDSIFLLLGIIVGECDAVVSITDKEFEGELSSAKDRGNLFFGCYCVFSITSGFLLWIFLFNKFKEIDNQLKRVLQVFPAGLVLSNFMLKSFLIKTSKDALDFVKNEI